MATKKIDIVKFITHPELLGLAVSPAQETLLRGIYGLPLRNVEQEDLWALCTGGRPYRVGHSFAEVTVIGGARAGKDSRIAAPIVCYEAMYGGHEKHLGKGERATIPLVAQDKNATKIAYGYIRTYFTKSPLLAERVIGDPKMQELDLDNNITIQCFPCTLRATRGFSAPVGVMDELAYYRIEAGQSDSDEEVQASMRRGMINFPNTRLVKISTPYIKGGVLYNDYKNAFGQDNPDLLVWKASSLLMNPSLKAERLEREKRLDPVRYAREYEADFVDDLMTFIASTWVDDAIVAGRHELPPRDGVAYYATVDPSGGGADHFTFAIMHKDGDQVVQAVLKGWHRTGGKALDLATAVKEISETLTIYHLREVTGDRYAGNWPRQEFQKANVHYQESKIDKSEAYLECEPVFAQGRIQLLDHPNQREWKLLEKSNRAGGKAKVDHPRGAHDDYANVAALGIAHLAGGASMQYRIRKVA